MKNENEDDQLLPPSAAKITEKKANIISSTVRGVTRSIFGIVATATLFTVSLVRGAVGACGHAVTAIGGTVVTMALAAVHVLNFIRYQATKGFNKLTNTSNVGNKTPFQIANATL